MLGSAAMATGMAAVVGMWTGLHTELQKRENHDTPRRCRQEPLSAVLDLHIFALSHVSLTPYQLGLSQVQ